MAIGHPYGHPGHLPRVEHPWLFASAVDALKLTLVVLLFAYHGWTHVLVGHATATHAVVVPGLAHVERTGHAVFVWDRVFGGAEKRHEWVYFGVGLLLLTVGLAYAIQVYKRRRKS